MLLGLLLLAPVLVITMRIVTTLLILVGICWCVGNVVKVWGLGNVLWLLLWMLMMLLDPLAMIVN